jgi:hypothetical protein
MAVEMLNHFWRSGCYRSHQCSPFGRATLPGWSSMPAPATANVTHAPDCASADATDVPSGHADTANARPTNSASVSNLSGQPFRLRKRSPWHRLCRDSQRYCNGGNTNQFDHRFPPNSFLLNSLSIERVQNALISFNGQCDCWRYCR